MVPKARNSFMSPEEWGSLRGVVVWKHVAGGCNTWSLAIKGKNMSWMGWTHGLGWKVDWLVWNGCAMWRWCENMRQPSGQVQQRVRRVVSPNIPSQAWCHHRYNVIFTTLCGGWVFRKCLLFVVHCCGSIDKRNDNLLHSRHILGGGQWHSLDRELLNIPLEFSVALPCITITHAGHIQVVSPK